MPYLMAANYDLNKLNYVVIANINFSVQLLPSKQAIPIVLHTVPVSI